MAVRRNNYEKPLIFKKWNKKLLWNVLKNLSVEDLSRVSSTSRRLNNLVQSNVKDLQVMVEWEEDEYEEEEMYHHPVRNQNFKPEFRAVTLKICSPRDFFIRYPPFKYISSLYLCYDDQLEEKIDLTKLIHLKYLKMRGVRIQLSSNRLPNVTHIDFDDPNSCEKQVFRNLKVFHLEVNIEDFSGIYNTTESEGVKFVFSKTLDILLDKDHEQVSFTICITNMELLLFEAFVDSLTTFLKKYEEEVGLGHISVIFKYNAEYERKEKDERRWNKVWTYLTEQLKDDYERFDLDCQPAEVEYGIPVL